jgi:tetratricopeptide (TPR) repeat protein
MPCAPACKPATSRPYPLTPLQAGELLPGYYDAAVEAARASWSTILGGVRIFPADGAWMIVPRGPRYEELRYRHEDCVGAALFGSQARAVQECRELLRRYTQLARNLPASFDYALCRFWCQYNLAAILESTGEVDEAKASYSAASQLLKELAPPPNDALARAELAWFLACCPNGDFRDAAAALSLSEAAVRLLPEEARCWESLGAARYCNEDFDGAARAFKVAVDLSDCDSGVFAEFHVAMSLSRTGKAEEAATRFDHALAVMQAQLLVHPDQRYWKSARAQAEAVLGLASGTAPESGVLYPPREWSGEPQPPRGRAGPGRVCP